MSHTLATPLLQIQVLILSSAPPPPLSVKEEVPNAQAGEVAKIILLKILSLISGKRIRKQQLEA
jgi:hypothetical protein